MPSLLPQPAPSLPDFQSLLVVGPYHASAPIHLALSHARENPNSRPLILSPSRAVLKEALARLNDSWLAANCRCGDVLQDLSRVDMLYPPTPVHLSLLLSMLRPPPSSEEEKVTSCMYPETTRIAAPDLIILHEPSQYFISAPDLTSYTVSSYLALISQVFAAIKTLTVSMFIPRLVVFDSQLEKLKLPVVKASPLLEMHSETRNSREGALEALQQFVEPFFDSLAVFEDVEDEDVIPSSQGDDIFMDDEKPPPTRRLEFFRVGEENPIDTIRWQEITRNGRGHNNISLTDFEMKETM